MHILKKASLLIVVLIIAVFVVQAIDNKKNSDLGLTEVSDGDSIFWLFQGGENNRYQPNSVYYQFDQALDEKLLLERLKDLTNSYQMLNRNVVMVDNLPYWQPAKPDWNVNFKILNQDADIEALRRQADHEISQTQEIGKGLPLFRIFLSADKKELIYIWHHVLSDFEGMFNKHAKHLFNLNKERTLFGYQIRNENSELNAEENSIPSDITIFENSERKIGFKYADFEVSKFILPLQDHALAKLGQQANMPMSDIFSFISLRAITLYYQDKPEPIRPIITPVSLRKSSLDLGEGNNRATRQFPVIFPLESTQDMYQRVLSLEPTSGSYEMAGKALKLGQTFPSFRNFFLNQGSPDYISNYFPLADMAVSIGNANLSSHFLRVPMVPYEKTKFAWSNYNGEVQLFMHTDPHLINKEKMKQSYEQALNDVLELLKSFNGTE